MRWINKLNMRFLIRFLVTVTIMKYLSIQLFEFVFSPFGICDEIGRTPLQNWLLDLTYDKHNIKNRQKEIQISFIVWEKNVRKTWLKPGEENYSINVVSIRFGSDWVGKREPHNTNISGKSTAEFSTALCQMFYISCNSFTLFISRLH